MVDRADDIAVGLKEALSEHRDVVVSVLADLDAAPASLGLGALSPASGDPKVAAALASIGNAIEPSVVAQLTSDDPKVRALSLSVLAKLDTGKNHDADAAIVKALADPAEQVRAAGMDAVAILAQRRGTPPADLVAALVKGLDAPAWSRPPRRRARDRQARGRRRPRRAREGRRRSVELRARGRRHRARRYRQQGCRADPRQAGQGRGPAGERSRYRRVGADPEMTERQDDGTTE